MGCRVAELFALLLSRVSCLTHQMELLMDPEQRLQAAEDTLKELLKGGEMV